MNDTVVNDTSQSMAGACVHGGSLTQANVEAAKRPATAQPTWLANWVAFPPPSTHYQGQLQQYNIFIYQIIKTGESAWETAAEAVSNFNSSWDTSCYGFPSREYRLRLHGYVPK